MRRNGNVSVVLVALMAAVSLLQVTTAASGANKPVKVKVNCPKTGDGKFMISVDPFEVEVKQDDGVEWRLDSDNSKNQDIRISAKDDDKWLYAKTTDKGNKTVVMTQMADNSANKTFAYKIEVYCGDADDTDPVILDPRIKVGGE